MNFQKKDVLDDTSNLGEVILEIKRHPNFMSMSAIRALDGTEVNVLCPLGTSDILLKHVALSKLSYVIRKQKYGTKKWA